MAGKCVLGIRERATYAGELVAHLDGTTRPDTALDAKTCRERRGCEPVVRLSGEPEAARAALENHRANRRRGRQPNEVVDLVIAGPPPWEQEVDEKTGEFVGPAPWDREKVERFYKTAHHWACDLAGPESKVIGSWAHNDETSPHLQFQFVPMRDGRISWKAVAEAHVRERTGRTGRIHHRVRYSELRDSLAEAMKPFGLDRGEVRIFDEGGQKAEPIDRGKAARHEEAVAKAERDRAVAERDRAEAAAAAAWAEQEKRAREARQEREAAKEAEVEAVDRRAKVEAELSAIEQDRTEARKAAVKAAEKERRAEAERQEEARIELQRIEDAIAVANSGRRGRKAKRGREILEAERSQVRAAKQRATQLAAKNDELVSGVEDAKKEVGRLQTENKQLADQVTRRGDRIDELERARPALWRRAYRLGCRRGGALAFARLARSHAVAMVREKPERGPSLRRATDAMIRVMRERLAKLPALRSRARQERQAEIRERRDWEWQAGARRGRGGFGC